MRVCLFFLYVKYARQLTCDKQLMHYSMTTMVELNSLSTFFELNTRQSICCSIWLKKMLKLFFSFCMYRVLFQYMYIASWPVNLTLAYLIFFILLSTLPLPHTVGSGGKGWRRALAIIDLANGASRCSTNANKSSGKNCVAISASHGRRLSERIRIWDCTHHSRTSHSTSRFWK